MTVVSTGQRPTSLSARAWVALRAVRAFSLPVSVLPALVAVAAVSPVGQWHWAAVLAATAGVALLHSAGNLLNDYFDFRYGVDRQLAGDRRRPGRVLVRGLLAPRQVLAEAVACLALACLPGAYLTWRCGPGALWFALAGAAALYAYTGPPLKLKYRALGEPLVFLTFGPGVMLAAAYVQTCRLEPRLLPLATLLGLGTTAILVGNNLRDRDEDAAAGIRTLAHLAAGRVARALYVGLALACVAGLAGLAAGGGAPKTLIAAPLLLVMLGKPLRHVWRDDRLADIDALTARFQTVLLLAVLAALLLRGD